MRGRGSAARKTRHTEEDGICFLASFESRIGQRRACRVESSASEIIGLKLDLDIRGGCRYDLEDADGLCDNLRACVRSGEI